MNTIYKDFGEVQYIKYTSETFEKLTKDKLSNGSVVSVDEFNQKYGGTSVPIHIDDSTQGNYECVCEFGIEVH